MDLNSTDLPLGLRQKDAGAIRSHFRTLLSSNKPMVVPGAANALGARLIQRSGFESFFVTGAGLANSEYALPDIGLLSLTDLCNETSKILDATDLPAIIDADTGFGGPLSVMRTVHQLERLGATAIQLEDQVMPKRCGHFEDKAVIDCDSMIQKLDAAQRARSDPNLVIIARTDARAVTGLEDAIQRGLAYADAGADAIFVEAPQSIDELAQIGTALQGVPLVVNIVEGGKTPRLPVSDLADLGFTIILYANFLLRAMVYAGEQALIHLNSAGTSEGFAFPILPWEDRQNLVDLNIYDNVAKHFPETH